jgi:type I restriction enzyme S subunit
VSNYQLSINNYQLPEGYKQTEVGVIPEDWDYWPLNTTLFVSDFRGNDPLFIYFFLKTIDYKTYSGKSGVPGVNRNDLHEIPIKLPPLSEQRAIATALSDVDALIAALDKLIAKKRHLKTATMQQLLTGKKRLPRRMDNGELIIDNDGNPVMFGPSMDNCQLSIDNYQLPKGYKQTEVGVIPEDWEPVRLGEVVTLQRGFDLPNRLRQSGSIPIISSSGIIDTHNKATASGPGVVTGRYGTIGEVFFVEEDFWPLNTTLFVSDFHNNDPKFIYFFLRTIDYKAYSGKSGVPGVNRNDLHEILVRQPSVEEQRAIATVLSDMDSEIAAIEARRAKTQAIKQGMMQQLLTGKVRLLDEGINN